MVIGSNVYIYQRQIVYNFVTHPAYRYRLLLTHLFYSRLTKFTHNTKMALVESLSNVKTEAHFLRDARELECVDMSVQYCYSRCSDEDYENEGIQFTHQEIQKLMQSKEYQIIEASKRPSLYFSVLRKLIIISLAILAVALAIEFSPLGIAAHHFQESAPSVTQIIEKTAHVLYHPRYYIRNYLVLNAQQRREKVEYSDRMINLINNARREHDVTPVEYNDHLITIAQTYTEQRVRGIIDSNKILDRINGGFGRFATITKLTKGFKSSTTINVPQFFNNLDESETEIILDSSHRFTGSGFSCFENTCAIVLIISN
jgi:hypothetical protein